VNTLAWRFYVFLAAFLFLSPIAAFSQSLPAGVTPIPVNAGTEVGLGGWYGAPQPPACTPQPAGTITATVAPKYGSLRYQNITSTLPPGYPCAGTQIISTVSYYTWNRTGAGEGYDYFHLQYTNPGGGAPSNSDNVAELITGMPSKLFGPPSQCPLNCAGDPVSVSSGNMYYEAKDYSTTGANPLSFTRYYNSRAVVGASTFATTLGTGWRSTFDRYIHIASSANVSVERANGQQLYFTLIGTVWTPESDVDITLTNSGSTWTLTDHDDTVETYTTTGTGTEALLNSIKARNGYTQTLHYTGSTLTSVTDSYARSLSFSYSGGLLSSVFTQDSNTISYGYTTAGSASLLNTVSFQTSPTSTITYEYGASPAPATALTSIVDEDGHTYASWTYDAYSRATQSQLGSGANLTTVVYYDDGSFNRAVTNALGVVDNYSYTFVRGFPKTSLVQRSATSTTPLMSRFFLYDTNGNLYSFNDWNNVATLYTNNSHGDPTQIIEANSTPVARTTTITYDTTWVHLPKTIVTPGLTTSFTFDANGNPLTKTLTDTTTTSIPYSTAGETRTWTYTWSDYLLASVQSPRTDVTAITTFGYDSQSTLRSITDALGHVSNVTSAQTGGYPQTVVDPNSVTRIYSWDARQRLAYDAVYTSGGNYVTYYNNDPTGELTAIYPPDGAYRTFAYDNAHRLIKVTDPYSSFVSYTLDALGDSTQAQTANGSTVYKNHTATFDALGRKLTDVGGMSQTTTFTYDKNGNALTIKDGLGNTTTRVFDALNRLSTSTDANSGVAQLTYDAHDRPLTVQDQNSHTTSYVYDGFGDVIQVTSPDTGTTVYHYDNNGNLMSRTDALGVVVNQTFDKLDRVLTTTYPADSAENVAYTYDQTGTGFSFGIGRLTSVTDAAGTLTRAYDERGNLLTEKRVNGGSTYTTSYTYNPSSRILSTTYPDGSVVKFAYDGPGKVYVMGATPAGAGSQTLIAPNINHFPFGPLQYISYGNGMSETWFFDQDYRVTGISANLGSITAPQVMNLNYAYDAANNLKTITDLVNSANSQTMTYDVLNRLNTATSGTGGYGSYTYTFDPVGNLSSLKIGSTTTTYSYASGTNRLSAIGSTTVSTNANGNITGAPIVGGSSVATYSYNNANRLSAASGGGISNAITGIVYDAFGRRFSKAHSSGTILYFYDQFGEVIEEKNGSTYTDYAYVDGMPIAILEPGASPAANQINYVSTDRIGTPQLVANTSQTTVWSNTYQPFGQGGNPTSAITNNIRLPGQEYDVETGFHYNLFRDYMPNLGRYLEADPIGLNGGMNTYLYAKANPGAYIDRTGLQVPLMQPSIIPEAARTSVENSNENVKESVNRQGEAAEALGGGMEMTGKLEEAIIQGAEKENRVGNIINLNPSFLGPGDYEDFVQMSTKLRNKAAQDNSDGRACHAPGVYVPPTLTNGSAHPDDNEKYLIRVIDNSSPTPHLEVVNRQGVNNAIANGSLAPR